MNQHTYIRTYIQMYSPTGLHDHWAFFELDARLRAAENRQRWLNDVSNIDEEDIWKYSTDIQNEWKMLKDKREKHEAELQARLAKQREPQEIAKREQEARRMSLEPLRIKIQNEIIRLTTESKARCQRQIKELQTWQVLAQGRGTTTMYPLANLSSRTDDPTMSLPSRPTPEQVVSSQQWAANDQALFYQQKIDFLQIITKQENAQLEAQIKTLKEHYAMALDPYIYIIMTQEDWEKFQKTKVFKGTNKEAKEGIIRACRENQVLKTYYELFPGESVVLVKIEMGKMGDVAIVKNESLTTKPGAEIWPRIHGVVVMSAVVGSKPLA